MAEISRAIMPGLVRTASNDSIGTDKSFGTTTDAGPWETPRTETRRFDYMDSRHASTGTVRQAPRRTTAAPTSTTDYRQKKSSSSSRSSGDRLFGMNGLTLDADSGISRNEDLGVTNQFGRSMQMGPSSSGLNIAAQRARRRL